MKIARCEKDGKVFFASLEGAYARPLKNEPYVGLALADGPAAPLKAVRLLTPVTPTKILAVGFNYRDHAEEFHKPIPKTPNIFMKPLSCLNGPDGAVELPGRCAGQAEHECELVAVIGRRSRFVTRENAPDYVLGYTCGNDVTARGMQAQSSQWSLCKGFDTFGPVGPCIDTSVNPACLDIELRLNGVVRQRSNTRNLIFDVAYLVSYLSHVMTLEPGDALFTGTPSGVSPIRAGDVMEVDIQGIGVLKNTVR